MQAQVGTLDRAALRQQIDHGHAADALATLGPMIAAKPEPAGVEGMRGLALYTLGKLPEAEQAFAAATAQDAGDRESVQMRGVTLYRMGRPAAAIPVLEGLHAMPGTQPAATTGIDPQYVLALCYLDTRRYDDARHAFAVQFGFPQDSAAAYLLAARMLLRREYLPVALEQVQKAIALDPRLPLAHRLLGEVQLAGNHLDEAVAAFEAERALNPLEPTIYDRLGDAYIRQNNFDRARRTLEEAVLLDPNATGPFILLGKTLLKQGDAVNAAGYLEHARAMDQTNFMTHSLLGQAYRQMGRADDAKRETDLAEKIQRVTAPRLDNVH